MNTGETQETDTDLTDEELQGIRADLHTRLARLLGDDSLSAEQKDTLAQQVLDVGCSLESLAEASQSGWSLRLGPLISHRSFAHATAKAPCWRIVPMENFTTPPTCGLSKHHPIKEVLNHLGQPTRVEPLVPRLLALGILLHQRLTGERLFPTYTCTDKPHVVVGGSTEECFTVESRLVHEVDRKGNENVWLAPVVRPTG